MKKSGICMACACTEADACNEGCSWANLKRTLCSACEPLSPEEREEKRKLNHGGLMMRLELLKDEALVIKLRMAVLESNAKPTKKRGGRAKRGSKQQPSYKGGS